MVRSNTKQDYDEVIGFINNSTACVAFSKGKRKTIIVGDQTTLIKTSFSPDRLIPIQGKMDFLFGEILTS
jgi:hypothetical protein